MAGFADELSIKLTAKDEMSAKLREAKKELTTLEKQMSVTRRELTDTGSPAAASELRRLEAEYGRVTKSMKETADASRKARRDLDDFTKGSTKATGAMGRLGASISKHAEGIRNAGLIGGAALLYLAKTSIDAASSLNESQSKLVAVFGTSSDAIIKWSDNSARSFGQSSQQAMEAAGSYGNLFQAFGVGREASAEMSMNLVQLAADLASFNNTSVDEALTSLQSALSGESEPMKKYGSVLSDVRMKEEAVRLSLIKTTKEGMTPAIKAQAAYSLIMKDTALAQGDFARTSDGLANSQRIAAAEFENTKAKMGRDLMPIMQSLMTMASKLASAFGAMPGPLRNVAVGITAISFAAMIAAPQIIAMVTALSGLGMATVLAGLASIGVALGVIAAAAAPLAFAYWMSNLEDKTKGATMAVVKYTDATTGATTSAKAYTAQGAQAAYATLKAKAAADDHVNVMDKQDDSMRRVARAAQNAGKQMEGAVAPTSKWAGSLGHVAAQATRAETALTRLSSAMDIVDRAIARRQARREYNTALAAFNKKPTAENAEAAITAGNTLAKTFRNPRKQAKLLEQVYPQLRTAINSANLPEATKKALIDPMDRALRKIAFVRAQLSGLAGALARTGDTPIYKRAAGGPVFGPGSGTSDSIPVMVSNGEYVIRAAAARAIGYDTLGKMNVADRMPSLPPIVNAPAITIPGSMGGSTMTVHQTINANGQIDYEQGLRREFRRIERQRETRSAGTR